MTEPKNNFAKQFESPLPKLIKFFTALKITAKTYRGFRVCTNTDILFCLMRENYYGIEPALLAMSMEHIIGNEETPKMREFFTEVYNDERLIIDFLNGKINRYYFARKKHLKKDKSETNNLMSTILSENGIFGLLDSL